MPRPICFLWLSILLGNLFQSITLCLSLLGTLENYLALVLTIPPKMASELDNLADFIPYTRTFLSSKSGIENNKDLFLFNNDSLSSTS